MKFHGITMVGEFISERLATLPSFDVSRDPGRQVYAIDEEKLYIGKETEWSEVGAGAGFGELDNTFVNDDILHPGFMYYIDTSSNPISGTMAEGSENGDVITVVDITGSFGTNTFTIEATGGQNIINDNDIFYCDTNNGVYIFFWDSTYGWRTTEGASSGVEIDFKPSNLSLDDTDVGSDGGNLWGIIETIDFSNSQDGAVWGLLEMKPEFNDAKDINIQLGYSLNGDENGTDVDLQFDYYALEDGDTLSTALSASLTETIVSDNSGAGDNVGNWVVDNFGTIKVASNIINDDVKHVAFKFTRLGSTDTYSGTLQVTNLKFYQ